jgi:hypothetical protein
LQRSLQRESHRFDADFNKFVKASKTLKALNKLICFTSNGTWSIYMVTVLNAYSYQPYPDNSVLDYGSEQILAKVLQVKKPKVIIHCHNDVYNVLWMARFNFSDGAYRLRREIPVPLRSAANATTYHQGTEIPNLSGVDDPSALGLEQASIIRGKCNRRPLPSPRQQ